MKRRTQTVPASGRALFVSQQVSPRDVIDEREAPPLLSLAQKARELPLKEADHPVDDEVPRGQLSGSEEDARVNDDDGGIGGHEAVHLLVGQPLAPGVPRPHFVSRRSRVFGDEVVPRLEDEKSGGVNDSSDARIESGFDDVARSFDVDACVL